MQRAATCLAAALRALAAFTLLAAISLGSACSGKTANPAAGGATGAGGNAGQGGSGGRGGGSGRGGSTGLGGSAGAFGGSAGTIGVDAAQCQPGETGAACTTAFTGCPSVEECGPSNQFLCPCVTCELELRRGECSWSLSGNYLNDSSSVLVTPPDGGTADLPEVAGETACSESRGWYAESTETTLTVRLCPVSCSDHWLEPEAKVVLGRTRCPPTE